MKKEDKAKELYNLYYYNILTYAEELSQEIIISLLAKKSALIAVNEIIKANEKDNPYQTIDLYSIFVNENGLIKNDLSTDGVHLNEQGYDAWVDFIRPIVSSLN